MTRPDTWARPEHLEAGDAPRWARVKECPKCGGARCKVAPDGAMVLCWRESRDGKAGSVHVLDGGATRLPIAPPPPRQDTRPIAPDDVLDRIYAPLLARVGLSEPHRAALLARGLTPEHVAGISVASTTSPGYRVALATAEREAHEAGAGRVPLPSTAAPDAILLGARDASGRVVAVGLRLTNPPPRRGKYRWAEGSKARCHVAAPPAVRDARIWITEGILKAEIASACLGAVVLALPGVSAGHAEASSLAGAIGRASTPVVIAFDSDLARNQQVRLARDGLAARLEADGFQVQIAAWDEAAGKGLDDLLVAGGAPTVTPLGSPGAAPVQAPLPLPLPGSDRTPRLPDYLERFVLLRASRFARVAGHATAANGLFAAAFCGVFGERSECATHGVSEGHERTLVCERWPCPQFARAHVRDMLALIETAWPKELAIGVLDGPDDPDGVCALRGVVRVAVRKLARVQALARGVSRAEAKAAARDVVSRLGFFVAPGALAVLSCDPDDAAILRQVPGLENAERAGRERWKGRLTPVLHARGDRLHKKLRLAAAQSLGEDPWCDRVVMPTGGRTWDEKAGWPSMDELRAEARGDQEPRDLTAKHCGGEIRFVLYHRPTGETYATRIGIPWTSRDAIKAVQEKDEQPDPEG